THFTLQGSKPKTIIFVVFNNKLNRFVAQIANPVKKDNIFIGGDLHSGNLGKQKYFIFLVMCFGYLFNDHGRTGYKEGNTVSIILGYLRYYQKQCPEKLIKSNKKWAMINTVMFLYLL